MEHINVVEFASLIHFHQEIPASDWMNDWMNEWKNKYERSLEMFCATYYYIRYLFEAAKSMKRWMGWLKNIGDIIEIWLFPFTVFVPLDLFQWFHVQMMRIFSVEMKRTQK